MSLCSNHPNVMGLVGWYFELADNLDILEEKEAQYNLCLVMELMDDKCVSA